MSDLNELKPAVRAAVEKLCACVDKHIATYGPAVQDMTRLAASWTSVIVDEINAANAAAVAANKVADELRAKLAALETAAPAESDRA